MTSPPRQASQEPMPRHVRIGLLLDLYGNLLTERQREFVKLHYDEDQSFGEIAQGKGVSRQAVHDAVKHAEKSLEQYERKLRLLERGIPGMLARIEEKPLPAEGEAPESAESEAPDADEWMLEVLDHELPAGGEEGRSPRTGASASGSGTSRADLAAVLSPIAEGLSGIRKRILRSGGIIYDADGLLNDVNRLLNRVNEARSGQATEPGGPQDV